MNLNWEITKAKWKFLHTVKGKGEVRSPYGANFTCTHWVDRWRARSLMGESDIIDRLREVKRPDDVIWDVGANIGIIACHLLKGLTSGQIVAFEPIPKNAERLRKNLELNTLEDRYHIQQLCLGDEETSIQFPIFDERVGAGGQSQISEGDPLRTIKVNQKTGDALIQSGAVLQPNIVKIDVEGAEWSVLQGMQSVLPSIRFLAIEVHPERLSVSTELIHRTLRNTGFNIEINGKRGEEYHLFATQHE